MGNVVYVSLRRFASPAVTPLSFTVPTATEILTPASTIFNSFTGMLALGIGLSLGVALLAKAAGLISI